MIGLIISLALMLAQGIPYPGPVIPRPVGASSYKRSITIDHTKCGSADSANFPLYVYISDPTLKTVVNGGHVQNGSGSDVLFYSDSSLTTQIASELEGYDATNGIVRAWVKVATLSASVDTVVYVSYGVASPPARTSGAWNSNFKGVWHFGDGTTLGLTDATGNGGTLTNNGTTPAVTGKIYGAASFNGTSQYLNLTPGTGLKPDPLTVSFWAQWSADTGTDVPVIMGTGPSMAWMFYHSGSTLYGSIGNFVAYSSTSTVGYGGTWRHLVMTSSSATAVKLYTNGTASTGTATPTVNYTNSGELSFGRNTSAGNYFSGYLDEIHIVGAELSQSWVTSEYNNQNSVGTFITIGAES